MDVTNGIDALSGRNAKTPASTLNLFSLPLPEHPVSNLKLDCAQNGGAYAPAPYSASLQVTITALRRRRCIARDFSAFSPAAIHA
jgi:hypothetical protein